MKRALLCNIATRFSFKRITEEKKMGQVKYESLWAR